MIQHVFYIGVCHTHSFKNMMSVKTRFFDSVEELEVELDMIIAGM